VYKQGKKAKLKLLHHSHCTECNLAVKTNSGTESDRNFDISLIPEEAMSILLHP
jgi:hypothetical protein